MSRLDRAAARLLTADRFDGVTFVSEEVRQRCERVMDVIEDASKRGHGPLRLDGFNKTEETAPVDQRTRPVVITTSESAHSVYRYAATHGGRVLRRFRTIDAAMLHYPEAELQPEAIHRARHSRREGSPDSRGKKESPNG